MHTDPLDLAIEYWPHEILAAGAWQLRLNLSIYDASYVALAELLWGSSSHSIDASVEHPGLRCALATP